VYAALSEYASKAGLGCQEGVTANVEEQSPPRIRGQGRAGQGSGLRAQRKGGKWEMGNG
jgi:hypothetical protein